MATSSKTRSKRRTVGARATESAPETPSAPEESTLVGLAHQLRSWTDSVLGIAGAAADVSLGAARSMLPKPEQRRALAKAGSVLRGLREGAGLSLREVGEAINMKDPTLLDLVENGKVALPFEVILRLAAVLARNDPIPFVLNLTNTYSPAIGRTLKALGIGRLVEHARREHDFINVYRARDAARHLSDAEFARVLAFVEAAFDLALDFTTRGSAARKAAKAAAGAAAAAGERRRPG